MSRNYMIIDGNSLGHFANNGAKLTLGEMPVQAIYNFLRNLRAKMALYSSYTPVVTWDGASWRNMNYPEYKANRDKDPTSKHEVAQAAMKATYKAQVPHIKKALRFLGVTQVFAMNMEADDLGAILTDRYVAQGARVILLTGDKDWLQLVQPNVTWLDFINDRKVTVKNFEEHTGVTTVKQFIEVKALCGDAGDNVPGVGGIGDKGAVDFIREYGSFNNFLNMCVLEKSVDISKLPKKIRLLIEDEAKAIAFERNLGLVDLRTPLRPDMLNLSIDKGEPDFEKFERFCDLLLFKSITQELRDWIRVFPHFNEIEQDA